MECEKIMELFHSELVTVNVGPRLFATALEQQGYRTVQVDWRPGRRRRQRNAGNFGVAWRAGLK